MRKRRCGVAQGEPTRVTASFPYHGQECTDGKIQLRDLDAGALACTGVAAIRAPFRRVSRCRLVHCMPGMRRRAQHLVRLMARGRICRGQSNGCSLGRRRMCCIPFQMHPRHGRGHPIQDEGDAEQETQHDGPDRHGSDSTAARKRRDARTVNSEVAPRLSNSRPRPSKCGPAFARHASPQRVAPCQASPRLSTCSPRACLIVTTDGA